MTTRIRNILLSLVAVAVIVVAGSLVNGNGVALAPLACGTGTNWDNDPC